jgi:hypothetical protein
MTKPTKVTVIGEGYNISANNYPSTYMSGDPVVYIGSNSGDVDVVGSFQDNNLPDCLFQFEFNNPWIGSPWAAVGNAIDDSGWDNDRTDMDVNDVKVFHLQFYDGGDDGEYNDFYVKVTRNDDTDTKNFTMELGYWPN